MGNSKAKGGNFEREVARELSLWWTNGKREDVFYRTNSSGGRFTMRRKSGKDTSSQGGDIGFTDPIGKPLTDKWSIEVKTGYGTKTKSGIVRWDVLDFLDSSQKEIVLEKMWKQSERDAELTEREPILIFRRNGRKACIMMRWICWQLLPHIYEPGSIKSIIWEGNIILLLKDFFEYVDVKKFKKKVI